MFSWFKRKKVDLAGQDEGADDTEAAAALVQSLYTPASTDEVLAAVTAAGFSDLNYYTHNPQLQQVFPNPERAALHFLAMQGERRRFPVYLDAIGCKAIAALPTYDRTIIADLLASLADAATEMGYLPQLETFRTFWPTVKTLRELGGWPYLILGDSHSTFYRRSTLRGTDWLLPLSVCCSGGSAIGLENPKSRSGYGAQLRALFDFLEEAEGGMEIPILIQFGQVDLEFVYPFRRVKERALQFDLASFHSFCAASVNSYLTFLGGLFPKAARRRVTILGVFPPAIKDEALRAGYVNDHISYIEEQNACGLREALTKLEWPDLLQRTAGHAFYNDLLQERALADGFGYADDFRVLLSAQGVLDQRFIPHGKGEGHHLDKNPTEKPLTSTIWRLIDPNSAPARIRFADVSEMPDPLLLPPLDQPRVDLSKLTPDQQAWRRDGVLIRQAFFPPLLLDPYITRRAAFRPGTAWNAVGWPDGNCYEAVPELRNIALYPPLMALLETLIGEPMLFHLALTGWISTERDWHQDDYLNPPFINTWYAAVWIALDTITPESGPFQYIPGSHRWPLLRGEKVRSFLTEEEMGRRAGTTQLNEWPRYSERFLSPAIEEKIIESQLPVVTFLPEKGDILIWHSRLMHRGSKRVEKWQSDGAKVYPEFPRKALICHYSGINHRPDMIERATHESGGSYAVFRTKLTLD